MQRASPCIHQGTSTWSEKDGMKKGEERVEAFVGINERTKKTVAIRRSKHQIGENKSSGGYGH